VSAPTSFETKPPLFAFISTYLVLVFDFGMGKFRWRVFGVLAYLMNLALSNFLFD